VSYRVKTAARGEELAKGL